jgi:two-component system, chemotaxis family, CheB/CheR fusion protein
MMTASTRLTARLLHGTRILVVDDEPDIRSLFEAVLVGCGATVIAADSARAALVRFQAEAFDAVVSDLSMPGEDGCWLAAELRRAMTERGRVVPLIAVTAHGRHYPIHQAIAAGFTAYLGKPVDPDDLCDSVARLLGRL